MTIFNWQSNDRGLFGNGLRAAGVIALGWVLSMGCAGELDPNRDYSWAFNDGSGGSGNGQGGGGNAQGGMTVTAPQDPACVQPLFNAQCTTCHGELAAAIGGNLDLRGPNLGQQLLNKTSSCPSTPPIIDGSNPDNSTMLTKVSNKSTACGGPMPQGTTTGLTGADLKCIQDWMSLFKH